MVERRSLSRTSPRDLPKGPGSKGQRTRPWTVAVVLVVLLVTIAFLTSFLVWGQLRSAGAKVERVDVRIAGDVCNVSVDLDVHAPKGRLGRTVEIVHGNGTERLSFDGEKATGSVSERAFRSMMADGCVDVKGRAEFELLGIIDIDRKVTSTFDISSIASSLRNLTVTNVTVTPTLKGYMILKMDLKVKMDERLDLGIIRTSADLVLSTGTYKVTIDSLVITGSTGVGKCTISVPTAAILSLAFMDRAVTFDCFGISGSFVIPQ
ncbi:MAG: hypothetical protein MUC62_02805 [Candidatus Thermoplasmatota archaeon]|jgi:hypothetical protein|nr:hypothetical protein [Candidatus Thermoplasmatota archaeon]